jgi:hypothetical protein
MSFIFAHLALECTFTYSPINVANYLFIYLFLKKIIIKWIQKLQSAFFWVRMNPPKSTVVIVHPLGRSLSFGTSKLMNLRFLF